MDLGLKGKVAVITGAVGGMGEAGARMGSMPTRKRLKCLTASASAS